MPWIVACFSEGEFEDVTKKDSLAEARAFSEGYGHGAGKYGAGSCGSYVLPDDLEEMKAGERSAKDAIKAVEKLIGTA